MDNTCKICNTEFASEAALHKHIKTHKIIIAEYCQKYYPRYDKHTGEIIKFKNKSQYLETDFNSRENLRLWLKNADSSVAREYCRGLLIKRKEKKGLIWTPCQVELRTTMLPPIKVYNSLFEDYYGLCESLGFKNRFSSGAKLESKDIDYKIIIDNREQLPLEGFTKQTEWGTLSFADYATNKPELTGNCYIERKSLDLIGSLSGGFERFCRELDKAKAAGAYVIILVEISLDSYMNFNRLPQFFHKNTRVTPEYIFHNVRSLIQKYDNIQFLFVDNREIAANIIEKIFQSGKSYQNIDLQYQYDIRNI